MLRTGRPPESRDSFLMRICHALDEPPRVLAKNIGVEYSEMAGLIENKLDKSPDIDGDDVWWKLSEYVNKKIGYLLAVRGELDKALQKNRAKRVQRVNRFRRVHDERTKL